MKLNPRNEHLLIGCVLNPMLASHHSHATYSLGSYWIRFGAGPELAPLANPASVPPMPRPALLKYETVPFYQDGDCRTVHVDGFLSHLGFLGFQRHMRSLVSCCSQLFILKSLCRQYLTWLHIEDTGSPVMGASSANEGMSRYDTIQQPSIRLP